MSAVSHDPRLGAPANDVEPEGRAERPRSPRMAARRKLNRACFDEPLREEGVTNGQLERALGLDEKIIRQMRDGERPIAIEDLVSLPKRWRALVLAKIDKAA